MIKNLNLAAIRKNKTLQERLELSKREMAIASAGLTDQERKRILQHTQMLIDCCNMFCEVEGCSESELAWFLTPPVY